jgi:hypothetical protein
MLPTKLTAWVNAARKELLMGVTAIFPSVLAKVGDSVRKENLSLEEA